MNKSLKTPSPTSDSVSTKYPNNSTSSFDRAKQTLTLNKTKMQERKSLLSLVSLFFILLSFKNIYHLRQKLELLHRLKSCVQQRNFLFLARLEREKRALDYKKLSVLVDEKTKSTTNPDQFSKQKLIPNRFPNLPPPIQDYSIKLPNMQQEYQNRMHRLRMEDHLKNNSTPAMFGSSIFRDQIIFD